MEAIHVNNFLRNYFAEKQGQESLAEIESIDLVDEGFLDSLDMIELATMIEIEFNKKLDFSLAETFSNMRRIHLIVEMVLK